MLGDSDQVSALPTRRLKPAQAVLNERLRQWLGAWPTIGALHVVGAAQRASAGCGDRVHAVLGVADGAEFPARRWTALGVSDIAMRLGTR